MARLSRRDLLGEFATGLGGAALAALCMRESAAAPITGESSDPPPHHPPRARRAIQIFLQGGLSQVDSFDYKPELERLHGLAVPGEEKPQAFMGKVGLLHKPHFAFRQRGESGLWISDLFPQLGELADELTVIRSMWSGTGNHTPATYEANSGFRTLGFPAAGAWISYGLGCEVDNLPTFVVLPDSRALPTGRANNWTSGFLPARHQGVMLNTSGPAVRDLSPATTAGQRNASCPICRSSGARSPLPCPARSGRWRRRPHAQLRAGGADAACHAGGGRLGAGIGGDAQSVWSRSQRERGFGRACLLGRRLLERGVRFVQLWSGAAFGSDVHWDAHGSVPTNHRRESDKIDRPVAGLLRDLRQRGLLDDTLVIFNTEFGRTPYAESAGDKAGPGRDHNPDTFSVWLAGAGLRHGVAYGASDEIGWKAAENAVDVHDFHATIMHLLGIDHTRLTFITTAFSDG